MFRLSNINVKIVYIFFFDYLKILKNDLGKCVMTVTLYILHFLLTFTVVTLVLSFCILIGQQNYFHSEPQELSMADKRGVEISTSVPSFLQKDSLENPPNTDGPVMMVDRQDGNTSFNRLVEDSPSSHPPYRSTSPTKRPTSAPERVVNSNKWDQHSCHVDKANVIFFVQSFVYF